MEDILLNYIYNRKSIDSIKGFADIKGEVNRTEKEVYFLRAIGTNSTYIEDIKKLDECCCEQDIVYNRISKLLGITDRNLVDFYSACYDKWLESNKIMMETKLVKPQTALARILGNASKTVLKIFGENKPSINPTIERNFIVKCLYWFDNIFEKRIQNWNEKVWVKIVAENITKEQEYLFFYMLTCMGADVLLLQYEKDADIAEGLRMLSNTFVLGETKQCSISEFSAPAVMEQKDESKFKLRISDSDNMRASDRIVVHIPQRNKTSASRTEKSFEELARLASSIVMICVHDEEDEVIGSGSGIMIGRKGYILTNHHVTCRGRNYSVRIEGDDTVYRTDDLIKYHTINDLAVIRIDKELTPLPIYTGSQKLVRGQKVAAIGSPLGLFNSVSDGIISGFRKVNDVEMIQFTAPISHGSSGGAVLNMYGEVIGIATLGIDEGQNINMAVTYEYLLDFVKGFQG